MAEDKFRGYVTWNTARRAWEEARCELKVWPKDWVRKERKVTLIKKNIPTQEVSSKEGEAKTMQGKSSGSTRCAGHADWIADAIGIDIHRMSHLIPHSSWPQSFTDLNAARDFISGYCYEAKFKYTGWPDLAPHKYRPYVNYNGAKNALEAGAFRVKREVTERKLVNQELEKRRTRHGEQEDGVKITRAQVPAIEKAKGLGVGTGVDSPQGAKTVDVDPGNNSPELNPDCSVSSSNTGPSEDKLLSNALIDVSAPIDLEEAVAIDSFKVSVLAAFRADISTNRVHRQDLVAELQRGYLLKSAFE